MAATETETVSLNLDGSFASEATRAAAAGDKLAATLDRMSKAAGAVKGPDVGGAIIGQRMIADREKAFASKWTGWKPPEPKVPPGLFDRFRSNIKEQFAKKQAGPLGKQGEGDEESSGGLGLGKNLKYIAKQAGIGKAALAALGTAAAFEATKLALGYRGMALLGAITMRTQYQIRQLFRRVDPMPVVRAWDRFTQLFNGASATGKYLTGLFSRIFNSLFGGVEKAEPVATRMFKQLVIGAQEVEIAWLKLRIAALPLTDAIGDLLGSTEGSPLSGMSEGFRELAGVIDAATSALQAFDEIRIAIGEHTGKADESLYHKADKASIERAMKARREFFNEQANGDTGPSARDVIQGIRDVVEPKAPDVGGAPIGQANDDGQEIGKAFGAGVVAGMDASGSSVGDAAVRMVKTVNDAARAASDTHSPSEMTRKIGRDLGAGEAMGLRDSAPGIQRAATAAMVPDIGAGSGAAGGGARAGGPLQVIVQHVWPAGVEKAKRDEIESAANAGTDRALRAYALALGVPVGA